MKQTALWMCLWMCCSLSAGAQSLTVEYNFGHGAYKMSGMKSLLEAGSLPVANPVVTDNFPGYLTEDARIGVEWKRHHLGALFTYMNTAGRRGTADYSGACYFSVRSKGYKLGGFYRFRLADEKLGRFTFQPYLQASVGVVLNDVKETYDFSFSESPESSSWKEYKQSGTNFFVEPAFGIKFGLCRYVALNLSVAYEWDVVRGLNYVGETNYAPSSDVDWSGYRAQAGLIFYLNLKK